jgi:Flp pilus assembly pilin Flp
VKLFKNSIFQNLSLGAAPRRLNNRSGQAMIEYVLILIIAVTMLFMAKGLFSSLNNYMTGYIGGYFRCLMTQGELPALNVSDEDLKKHLAAGYKCSIAYTAPPATGASGNASANVGTTNALSQGATKATASSRGNSAGGSSKKTPKKKTANNQNSGDGGSDDSSRFSQVQNRSQPYNTADSSGDQETSITSSSIAKSSMFDDKPDRSRRVSGRLQESILKNTRGGLTRRDNGKRFLSSPEDDMRPGPRTTKLTPPQRGVAALVEEPETEMGFGYFLKWLVMAGIGIAIFIFFGGQVMNYTNSDSN